MSFNDWVDVVKELVDNDPFSVEEAKKHWKKGETPLEYAQFLAHAYSDYEWLHNEKYYEGFCLLFRSMYRCCRWYRFVRRHGR